MGLEGHDVALGSCDMDYILVSSNIIRSVIHFQGLVLVEAVALDDHWSPIVHLDLDPRRCVTVIEVCVCKMSVVNIDPDRLPLKQGATWGPGTITIKSRQLE